MSPMFTPNAMQEAAADAILHTDNDVVILSPTGTGKTLAYMLPLTQLLDSGSDSVQAVVIVPGRELALQSAQVLSGASRSLRSMACYGGRPAMDEHRTLRKVRPQVVFATPGRMNDHLDKGNISAADVRFVVIDEFDKCLEMGFQDEMQQLMLRMPAGARRILLSATDAEAVPSFVHLHRCRRVDFLDEDEPVNDRVALWQVRSPEKDKLGTLSQLLRQKGAERSIVFVNHREAVERIADYLTEEGFGVSRMHGGLEQKERETALYRFSNGSASVLVCTDLGSRGLDISGVDNIIHYHLPETERAYVHRVGRTARWEARGSAYFLLSHDEKVPEYAGEDLPEWPLPDNVPAPVPPAMTTLYIGKGKKDKISKGDIVGFLCKTGGIKASAIGRIDVLERCAYAAVARQEAPQVIASANGQKIKGHKTIVEEMND